MSANPTERDCKQRRLLEAPVGQKGSGVVRYAAAMYFHRRGLFGPDILEIYRVCARQDAADPREVARIEGVEHPELPAIG